MSGMGLHEHFAPAGRRGEMESRFDKSPIRDLVLAIGLACASIALLLACAGESMPSTAASPKQDDVGPAWASTEPVTTEVGVGHTTWWVIDRYGVTIVFWQGAVRDSAAVFTFTPRTDLPLPFDLPLRATPYLFSLDGYLVNTGDPVSLWRAIDYIVHYEDSELGNIEESTLEAYREDDRWEPQGAELDTLSNYITWTTKFTGRFGLAGSGPRTNTYLPVMFSTSSRSF
jgi:hypothetical protein